MLKEIIKCDICKRELDKNIEGNYYDVYYVDMPGWIAFRKPHPEGVQSNYQICEECFSNLLKKEAR